MDIPKKPVSTLAFTMGATFSIAQPIGATLARGFTFIPPSHETTTAKFTFGGQESVDRSVGGKSETPSVDTRPMMTEPISREELNAKLALTESRTETQLTRISASIEKLSDAITGQNGVAGTLSDLKRDNQFTRATVIGVVLTSALGVVALVMASQSNILTAFEAVLAAHPPTQAPASAPEPPKGAAKK